MRDRDDEIYCPVCWKVLYAINDLEVDCGKHDYYIFVHDDIEHSESGIVALDKLMQ